MRLPDNLREQLKIPLGILIPEIQTTKENILTLIPVGSFLITVGDATTEKILSYDIIPSLQIIDSQEKRKKRTPPKSTQGTSTILCKNPPGEIAEESIEIIKNAMKSKNPVRILVEGEEDLLVIPVCIHAPKNAIVMYGQPNEGLVVVKISEEIKKKTKSILKSMN